MVFLLGITLSCANEDKTNVTPHDPMRDQAKLQAYFASQRMRNVTQKIFYSLDLPKEKEVRMNIVNSKGIICYELF